MLENPMDILPLFPVRKTKEQKKAFREEVQVYAERLGYDAKIECSGRANNVVIGDPENAEYLVTAHYDTCAHLPFPILITPTKPITFIGYQLLVVALYFVVSFAAAVIVALLTLNTMLAYYTWLLVYLVYFGMLLLMLVGPANKNNANDNTSGVVTVLEMARTLPENLRSRVCFVLFDLEEAGLVGSAAYRKAHKAASERQTVLNLDCVGDGDYLVMFPTKKLGKDAGKMAGLDKITGKFGKKSLKLHKKGFSVYPSDQKNFPLGVGISAFSKAKIVGLYCSRIRTNRDTNLDPTNVNILRAALITYISGTAAQ